MNKEKQHPRNVANSALFVLLSLVVINFFRDPPPGSTSKWAALSPRSRGCFRFCVGIILGIFASFALTSEFGLAIIRSRDPSSLDPLSLILLALVVYPCVWLSWGLHGIVTGTNWNGSILLIRLIFVLGGCVFGMFAVLFSKAGLDLLAASYYRDNPTFSILRDNTIELKDLCYQSSRLLEERTCLENSRPRIEQMKEDVEHLVTKYPSLKERDVIYSNSSDPTRKTGEVFSYNDFMNIYKHRTGSE